MHYAVNYITKLQYEFEKKKKEKNKQEKYVEGVLSIPYPRVMFFLFFSKTKNHPQNSFCYMGFKTRKKNRLNFRCTATKKNCEMDIFVIHSFKNRYICSLQKKIEIIKPVCQKDKHSIKHTYGSTKKIINGKRSLTYTPIPYSLFFFFSPKVVLYFLDYFYNLFPYLGFKFQKKKLFHFLSTIYEK